MAPSVYCRYFTEYTHPFPSLLDLAVVLKYINKMQPSKSEFKKATYKQEFRCCSWRSFRTSAFAICPEESFFVSGNTCQVERIKVVLFMLALSEPGRGGHASKADRIDIKLGFGIPIVGAGYLLKDLNPFDNIIADMEKLGGRELALLVSAANTTRIGLEVLVLVVLVFQCEVAFIFIFWRCCCWTEARIRRGVVAGSQCQFRCRMCLVSCKLWLNVACL